MGKFVKLTLPEFAFIESSIHEQGTDNDTQGRNIVAHIRSGAIIEFFPRDEVRFNNNIKRFTFTYKNKLGIEEQWVSAVHVSGIIDYITEEELFKEEVLRPTTLWFMHYLSAEDNNVLSDLV